MKFVEVCNDMLIDHGFNVIQKNKIESEIKNIIKTAENMIILLDPNLKCITKLPHVFNGFIIQI